MVSPVYAQMPHAKFEFLSANYDLKHHDGRFKPYKIFNKNGIRVGVLEWN
jgi:5'-nucleotidase